MATYNVTKWKLLSRVQLFATHGLYNPWNSPGQNTGVGSHSLLQRNLSYQGLNPGLPHYRWILYELSHQWKSRILEWVTYHFSSRYSRPRNRVGDPLLQADYLPAELLGRPIVVKWIKNCGVDRITPQVGETDRSSIWCKTIACALSVVSSSLQLRGL